MLQATVDRIADLIPPERVVVATGQDFVELVAEQLPALPRDQIIGEPGGRGSAAAIGLGALLIRRRDPDAVMVVLSADHMIRDVATFQAALLAATEAAAVGSLVTLGILPNEAHTGYGYIQRASPKGNSGGFTAYQVARFVEKPDPVRAEAYVRDGNYSWNAGIFVWQVSAIMEAFQAYMPELLAQLEAIDSAGGPSDPHAFTDVWDKVRTTTIDYGVLEHAGNMVVLPVDIGWNDVGDWDTLTKLASNDGTANVVQGDHIAVDTTRTLIFTGSDRVIATIGLDNFLVIDTGDVVLIAPRDRAQDVRKIVDQLRNQGRTELL